MQFQKLESRTFEPLWTRKEEIPEFIFSFGHVREKCVDTRASLGERVVVFHFLLLNRLRKYKCNYY